MHIRFVDTLRPLVFASFGSVAVHLAFMAFFQHSVLRGVAVIVLLLWVWIFSLIAGLVLVAPILALAPGLRRPSILLAAIWGIASAFAFQAVVMGWNLLSGSSALAWAGTAAAGAVSGVVYAIAARSAGIRPSSI